MRRAAHDEVARVIEEQPGRLRRAGATAVLSLLSASALSPVAVAVLGGGSVAEAIAGIAGNVGSGYLTTLVTNVAARVRGRGGGVDEARELLATELQSALEQGDEDADELRDALTALLQQVGGWETAVGELRGHLLSSFEELRKHAAEQRRHNRRVDRRLEEADRRLEEIVDRLRLLTRERQAAPSPPPPVTPLVAAVHRAEPPAARWEGGAEVTVGDRVYLLHDVLLDERTETDGTVTRRARALRLVPSAGRDRYVWLRQVRTRPGVPGSQRALQALDRERRLLSRLGTPRVAEWRKDGPAATLALAWPSSRRNVPYDLLSPAAPPTTFTLLGGIAGLCETLARLHDLGATHRYLAPDRIVVRDDGRLVLLDLGLAGHEFTPGEGPADYQAPEQRRRGDGRPGPRTDVYQLAAVAYHLLTGHPPHPRTPLPVRSQARDLPEPLGQAIDTALNPAPSGRPTAGWLAAAFRQARDRL